MVAADEGVGGKALGIQEVVGAALASGNPRTEYPHLSRARLQQPHSHNFIPVGRRSTSVRVAQEQVAGKVVAVTGAGFAVCVVGWVVFFITGFILGRIIEMTKKEIGQ